MMDKKYFIIDFDSTFITVEGLDELAKISLSNDPKKIALIEQITKNGMTGKISFRESLEKRLKLMSFGKAEIEKTARLLRKKISPSILRNKKFFKQNASSIYLISGGFEELIFPAVSEFGIPKSHILANKFIFKGNKAVGFDKKRATSQAQGKAQAVKDLNLEREVIIIGDGFTDLEIRRVNGKPTSVIPHLMRDPEKTTWIPGQARKDNTSYKFIAFTENVYRESIVKEADLVVRDFDELLFLLKIPSNLSYPKSRMKALLLENIEYSAVEILEKEGYQVELLKTALDEAELIEKIKDVSVLGIRSKTRVTQNVLSHAKKLKVVGTFSIGTDQMDLKALTLSGIPAFNAPFQNTRSVVELAIGEMIMLMRRAIEKNNKLHKGIWDKSAQGSNEIRGKTLGIVGFGNIGSQLSVLAENLGMDVIFYDAVEKLALGNAKRISSLKELLKTADVISIHVSGDRSNTNIISGKEFELMKDHVIFLNLSRGFVVDIKALVKYLKNGKIRGAGLDVFPKEPKGKDDPFESELQNLPNVLLTPHIAGSTEEAQKNIAEFVSGKIIDFMNTGNTYLSVNMPNIQLPEQGSAHRLLHLHKNVPGVLAAINNVLANHNINILGQYLKTNEEVGYVITDVDKKYNQEVLNELKKIPDTISFRVLY